MNKQTVYIKDNQGVFLVKAWNGQNAMHSVSIKESVYVLTEQELEERDETISIEFADWTTRNGIYMDVFKEWYHVPNGCSKLLAKTTKELYEIFLTTKANEILNNK